MAVQVERNGPITTVILSRPEVRNAVDRQTAEELVRAFRAFDGDPEALVGGQAGRVFGLGYASFGTVRWFFFLPIAPIAAVVIIAINILVISGLAAHGEFFRTSSGGIASLM